MTTRIRLLAAGVAVAALAGPATAQTDVRQRTTTTTTTTEVRKASVVMNANVVLEGGATVGKVTDFVLSDGGCVEYVVVDYDNKFVLLPYQVVRLDPARHVVSVNVTREKWQTLPTFTGSNWPVHDEAYLTKVRSTFGVRESGYRGDRDRRPMDRGDDRRDNRGDRDANRGDRRETAPPQRRDVENPTRPETTPPPATRPGDNTRPGDTTRPGDRTTPPDNRNRPGDNTRPGDTPRPPRDPNRTPPPPPPGTNPPPA